MLNNELMNRASIDTNNFTIVIITYNHTRVVISWVSSVKIRTFYKIRAHAPKMLPTNSVKEDEREKGATRQCNMLHRRLYLSHKLLSFLLNVFVFVRCVQLI